MEKDKTLGVYLWGGPFGCRYRFTVVTNHMGKLWADLRKSNDGGYYLSGETINENEITPISEVLGKLVKHKDYGCMGILTQYCTTEPHKSLSPKRLCSREYVFVRWQSYGPRNLILNGWVNINDLEFLTN